MPNLKSYCLSSASSPMGCLFYHPSYTYTETCTGLVLAFLGLTWSESLVADDVSCCGGDTFTPLVQGPEFIRRDQGDGCLMAMRGRSAVKGALKQWFIVDALLIPPLFSVHGVMWFNHLIIQMNSFICTAAIKQYD